MVDAGPAREHLLMLQAQGVGQLHAARRAGVGEATIWRVRSGARQKIRPAIAAAILGVKPALARGQLVNSYGTRRLIRALEGEGFTRAQIAARLGLRSRQLRIYNRVTVRTALRVRALWLQVSE